MSEYLSLVYDKNPLAFGTYLLFILAAASLWILSDRQRWLSYVLYGLSLVCGYYAKQFELQALIPLAVILVSLLIESSVKIPTPIKWLTRLAVFAAGGLLILKWIPGFSSFQAYPLQSGFIKPAYTLNFSLGKASVGFLLSAFFIPLANSKPAWLYAFTGMLKALPAAILVLAGAGIASSYIAYDPKLPDWTPLWIVANLFFVSLAEEAFFRGFIQEFLSRFFNTKLMNPYIAIVITALLSGLAHYWGGINYVLLSTVAGLFYGYAYMKGGFESAILTHFGLNLTHFLLFSYPRL